MQTLFSKHDLCWSLWVVNGFMGFCGLMGVHESMHVSRIQGLFVPFGNDLLLAAPL